MVDARRVGALIVAGRTLILRTDTDEYRVSIDAGDVRINDRPGIPTRHAGPGEVRVGPGTGRRVWVASSGDARWVFLDGQVYELELQRPGRRPAVSGSVGSLAAPMPASVVRVAASPGDRVRKGDALIILEAMKMELPVRAPADGVVKSVYCKAGDLVTPGTPLIDLE
jgi:acetyl/propionyl-CoA carboxylase alpha subunit